MDVKPETTVPLTAEKLENAPAKDKKSHSTRTRNPKPAVAAATQATASVNALAHAVAPETFESSHAEIARLAYTFWEQRGYQHGYAEQDWLRAEQQVLDAVGAK